MKNSYKYYLLTVLFVLFLHSCEKGTTPRPYGYFRVDLPTPSYTLFDSVGLPYAFDKSNYAEVVPSVENGGKYWINIHYLQLKAYIYCSYKPVNRNLTELIEDTRKIVYKHTVRADAITEQLFENLQQKTYGILYDLKGNTASNVQFVLTDSIRHFFRGALYFESRPNKDSIAPMYEYVKNDIIKMMESFRWKK